jgi:pimeloyl-ACP methyl ester carboxylesterase
MKDEISADGMTSFDDLGKGRPVVLLHAFPLARTMWRPQVEVLSSQYRVITPDLRGFGGSRGFTGPPSIEQMADDVAALLDGLKLNEPVVLGGLSMGGYVSLAFARRHPARLRALLLADTKSEADDTEARANRDRAIAFVRAHVAPDFIDQMLPKLVSPETAANRPTVLDEVRNLASAQSPAAIIAALEALRDRPDATPALGNITVPTLILVGRDDALTPPAKAEVMAARIPHAQLVTIIGAGHLSNLEQPELFTQAVQTFLAGVF